MFKQSAVLEYIVRKGKILHYDVVWCEFIMQPHRHWMPAVES